MRFRQGQVIDGFTLEEEMPSGGMASLWRARHPDFAIPIVLKIPFLDPGQDVSVVIGYEVEALILKRLSGPHVPRYIRSGELSETPYLAMEFVAGESLARIAKSAPLPPAEVARIGAELAVALASLHEQQVAHLDLKPENVILAERGAVLLDFGLSRHAGLPDLLAEESNVPMGSAGYIAPEQVLGDRSDPASDIFALGAILYLLAAGELPFDWPSTTAGMKRRLYHAPKPPSAVNPKVPAWLETVIRTCLEVDRGRRYTDAARVAFDLRNPEQVAITAAQPPRSWWDRFLSIFQKREDHLLTGAPTIRRRQAGPALILTAVDLVGGTDPLAGAVLAETGRLLATRPDSRLACLTVLKTEIIRETTKTDDAGRSLYIKRLVALKDWARPLGLAEERISYHVIEAVSAADAILRYAEHNRIGHIVIGARSASALRRHLGSVSSKVVAEADCSVTVVRLGTA
ncbi:bifunctional serine/threonine-protein kinase/universal stress protein [Bosea sp. (in: a-proteobacteria)]|uniref:bifunctional serine/threonine-protein kinase/universal stress protein n=1 Tax=Bosea sp. (in: a-proteobacteria) TaxID=1871050 RepID=UPI0026058230|nr:bifunctional serine/threonine-protein kinase/universal stress protein [Bosea sp. (in: a-proteobacteria)]MCO5090806.1 bifunctional serine/threonine-protein kinase/universal stress protein [Bosea sp. (in: a-proteobacteria)]